MDAVTVGDVERALVDVLQLDEIFDLLQRDIDGEMIVTLLRDYDFTSRPERLCEVELGESILPPHYPIALREAKVKLKGEIWLRINTTATPFHRTRTRTTTTGN